MRMTERRQMLLALLIKEYVNKALPVGSETLAKMDLGVSSATIRNELAALEEEGFLTHPHTSAGRVPTEKGYRYFVETLMDNMELTTDEQQMIRHQFHQVTLDVEQWMRLSAAVLAHTSKMAALVTAPSAHQTRFKHVELIAISEMVAMMVLILQAGTVKQQMLYSTDLLEQEELRRIANRLNEKFAGRNVQEIREQARAMSGFAQDAAQRIQHIIEQMDHRTSREIYRDGLLDILRQPEFIIVEKMQQLLEVLEQRTFLEEMLNELAPARGVQVVIGSEGGREELNDYSLVMARYGIEGEASGVLGVIGPLRMPYPRAVSAVKYVSQMLDDLMLRFYSAR
ncbi:MAG: heat-inducible transcription repressor HrcA [Chloroflexota bacterium]|nr:MAG: heat-inducible transcription repressor HrcA [Chloroflexota bacterium]